MTVEQVQAHLATGFVSAVGHEGTAALLSRLLAIEVVFQCIAIQMQVADKAVILRMKQRLPEGRVFTQKEIAALDFELGLLERIA